MSVDESFTIVSIYTSFVILALLSCKLFMIGCVVMGVCCMFEQASLSDSSSGIVHDGTYEPIQ